MCGHCILSHNVVHPVAPCWKLIMFHCMGRRGSAMLSGLVAVAGQQQPESDIDEDALWLVLSLLLFGSAMWCVLCFLVLMQVAYSCCLSCPIGGQRSPLRPHQGAWLIEWCVLQSPSIILAVLYGKALFNRSFSKGLTWSCAEQRQQPKRFSSSKGLSTIGT